MFINGKWFPLIAFEGDSGGGTGGSGTGGEGDKGNEGGQGSGGTGDKGTQGTGNGSGSDNGGRDADSEVAKAYEKLRTAEQERDTFKKQAGKARSLEEENSTLKTENAELKTTAQREASSRVLSAKARELNFHRPERAFNALQAYTDVDPLTLAKEDDVEKALRDLAKNEPHLVGQVPPSGGPVHPASSQEGGNAAVNRAIRSAAGRG